MSNRGQNLHVIRPTSYAAYQQIAPELSARCKAVLDIILSHPRGITMKEVAAKMRVPIHTISGRGTQLRSDNLIRGTGERRNGSEVLVPVLEQSQKALFEVSA